jgi:hypothetical protein
MARSAAETKAELEAIKKLLGEIYDRVDDLVLIEHDWRAMKEAMRDRKAGRRVPIEKTRR